MNRVLSVANLWLTCKDIASLSTAGRRRGLNCLANAYRADSHQPVGKEKITRLTYWQSGEEQLVKQVDYLYCVVHCHPHEDGKTEVISTALLNAA